jgi:hypothetical protein
MGICRAARVSISSSSSSSSRSTTTSTAGNVGSREQQSGLLLRLLQHRQQLGIKIDWPIAQRICCRRQQLQHAEGH